MKTLFIILKVLSYMPPLGPQPDQPAPRPRAPGTATIVLASCRPGDTVTLGPGNYRSYVQEDGTVMLKVPAQMEGDDPYQLQDRLGKRPLNGIAAAGHMLTGTCI